MAVKQVVWECPCCHAELFVLSAGEPPEEWELQQRENQREGRRMGWPKGKPRKPRVPTPAAELLPRKLKGQRDQGDAAVPAGALAGIAKGGD